MATAALQDGQVTDVKHLRFPRVDYAELQKQLHTRSLDYSTYNKTSTGKFFRQLERTLRSDLYLATISLRKSLDYSTIFTWSERAGIPFAIYKRFLPTPQRFVTMFTCWSARQEFVITKLRLFKTMDTILVHCASMQEHFIRLGAPRESVRLIHYSIDQNFFAPRTDVEQRPNLITSVGEARSRDYGSLFEAVKGLSVTLEVAGFGHWYAREIDTHVNSIPPLNVTLLKHLSHTDLRHQYASSQFVVIPVHDLVYSAGATASMEAGSMGRAVVAFRSRGISDYIIDGETGILVEPGNVQAMRDAIESLLANPKEAKRLGDNARQRIVEELNLERYLNEIAAVLTEK